MYNASEKENSTMGVRCTKTLSQYDGTMIAKKNQCCRNSLRVKLGLPINTICDCHFNGYEKIPKNYFIKNWCIQWVSLIKLLEC